MNEQISTPLIKAIARLSSGTLIVSEPVVMDWTGDDIDTSLRAIEVPGKPTAEPANYWEHLDRVRKRRR